MKTLKKITLTFTVLLTVSTFAAPVTTVQELVAALESVTDSSQTIEIASGDYDLTGVAMRSDASFGDTHLYRPNATLVGKGASADDVRLIGSGLRVLWAYSPAKVRNLTITNGCAEAISGQSNSGRGGGVFGNCTVSNCVIAGCSAVTGGATRNYTVLQDCRITGNTAKTGGGVYDAICNGCTIAFNRSAEHGGGAYGATSLYDCHVISNTAASMGGGACAITFASNCWFIANTSGAQGGAVASWGSSGMKLIDCTITNNYAGNIGGGVFRATVMGGAIAGNYSTASGGGVGGSDTILSGVDVHDNYAAANGGGMVDGSGALRCTFRNNLCGSNGPNVSGTQSLLFCDISGTTCFQVSATGCRFHNIGPAVSLAGNPHKNATFTPTYILNDYVNCTNCLFYGNRAGKSDAAIFGGNSSAYKKSNLVNCTIISNAYPYTFKYFRDATYKVSVVNCVFWGNTAYDGTTLRDISMGDLATSDGVRFSHCAYGISNVQNLNSYVDEALYQFGVNGFGANPRFVMDADVANPYALKTASPLIGRGKVFDWMSTSTDIRGDGFARLRDGKVDIGCYQCWLTHPGFVLSFR